MSKVEVGLMQSSWRMAPQYVWSSWCLAGDVGQESDGPKAGRQDMGAELYVKGGEMMIANCSRSWPVYLLAGWF